MSSTCTPTIRAIAKKFKAHSQREGAGFIVHRPYPGRSITDAETDPYLMLDELGPVEYKKGEFEGAPWHPHRGFDTVMYLKSGEGKHQDSMGNSGILKAGDVQYMSAASGIIHDEGRDHPGGTLHGFQMWINRPAARKMDPPSYQHLTAATFQFREVAEGLQIKLVAGAFPQYGVVSPLELVQPILYADVRITKNTHTLEIPAAMTTAMIYVYEGEGFVGAERQKLSYSEFVKFADVGDRIQVAGPEVEGKTFGFLLMCGVPIKEPIARYGPFVMNTDAEIQEALRDYQTGNLVRHKATERII